jgi:hypothetical protein
MDEKLRKSRKQERDGAKRFGGTVNSQSGAGWIKKGDVTTPTEIVEFKYTDKKSYSLKVHDLIETWMHACFVGKRMVFGIEFMPTPSNEYTRKQRYVLLTEDDYHADQEKIKDLEWELDRMTEAYTGAQMIVTAREEELEELDRGRR